MPGIRSFGTRHPEHSYRVRPAAYAVVLDETWRVACVAEESGLFLPGGGVEAGENSEHAVHREVAEECARALEIITALDSAIQFFATARGEFFELHASFYLARFGRALDRPAQHELSWRLASPEPPAFFHECHRWAVQEALRRAAT